MLEESDNCSFINLILTNLQWMNVTLVISYDYGYCLCL